MSTELTTAPDTDRTAMVEVAASRAAQETQAAMIVAQRFPRDETAAFNRVMKACKRKGLAESAMYVYPKGKTQVTGPSIRLAEVLAQCWGNLEFGIAELEQRDGESTIEAFCWDLETNTRKTTTFTVPHIRFTRSGSYHLKDPRDIYEMTANQGARRLRACILAIIPADMVEAAVAECEKTLAGNNAEPLSDRVRKMVVAFEEHGVTQEQIETRLGHRLEATIEPELVMLRKAYMSIKDNMAHAHDLFPAATSDDGKTGSEVLAEQIDGYQPVGPAVDTAKLKLPKGGTAIEPPEEPKKANDD